MLTLSCYRVWLRYPPWIVQLSSGPVDGSASQNWTEVCECFIHDKCQWLTCVCNNKPWTTRHSDTRFRENVKDTLTPGISKQHVLVWTVVFKHEVWPDVPQPLLIRLKIFMESTRLRPNTAWVAVTLLRLVAIKIARTEHNMYMIRVVMNGVNGATRVEAPDYSDENPLYMLSS